jgi:predicted MFS family arabinose efflux permease
MPAMSLGQMSEVAGMALLGVLLTRWNFKKVFALGIIFSAVRFIGLLIGGPKIIALVGIFFHGLNFALFYGGSFVYVDGLSEKKAKTGVQQLFLLATMGLANLAGNSSGGWIMDLLTSPETGEVFYRRFWMFPLILCGVAFILIIAFFRDSGQEALSPP